LIGTFPGIVGYHTSGCTSLYFSSFFLKDSSTRCKYRLDIIEALLQILTHALGEPRGPFGIDVRRDLANIYSPPPKETQYAPELTHHQLRVNKLVCNY
jgi:hypothetical protein